MEANSPAKMELDGGIPGEFGMVCVRKIKNQRRKRQKLLIIDLFFDFAKNTTLHGLRYITEVGLTTVEKLFWILTFMISMILCFFLIQRVWYKWLYSPVIVSFNERMIPVGEVMFPSITVCPQWKCNPNQYNYMGQYKKYSNYLRNPTLSHMSQEDIKKLEDAILICADNLAGESSLVDRNITDSSIVKHIRQMSPTLEDVFTICRWRGMRVPCHSAFKEVLTEEGVCFNFNAFSKDTIFNSLSTQSEYSYMNDFEHSDWLFDNGINLTLDSSWNVRNIITFPIYGREYGAEPDFDFILEERPQQSDKLCNSLSNGFKIYMQHPADMPQSSLYYYAAIPGQVTSLAVKATIMNTSESLKGYRYDQRQCYFPEDRKLKYFKMYTPDNCRLECLSLYTYWMCQCVWFHMPHTNSSEICTLQKWRCVKNARDDFASKELKKGFDYNCDCLPSCDSTRYDAEILKTNFDLKKFYKAYFAADDFGNSMSWMDGRNYSRVETYFRDPSFVSMRRSELFGVSDFLANCGGLLGLFLGFSFLSLVEIFYFLTLRLWCTLKKDIKQEKKAMQVK